MAQRLNIRALMVDDDEQVSHGSRDCLPPIYFKKDSTLINDLFIQIHHILIERQQLVNHIGYDLNEKGLRDKKRWQKMLIYPGPDQATIQLLTDNADRWFENPSTFWDQQELQDMSSFPPAAQIIGCFLRTKSDLA